MVLVLGVARALIIPNALRMKRSISAVAASLADASPWVEDIALSIAADEYPALRPQAYRDKLDALAEPLRARLTRGDRGEGAHVGALVRYMYGDLGFRGELDDYYNPRNSFLNDVIDRRVGNPVTLAVVLIALGARVGVTLQGVAFPGNFLVLAEHDEARLYIDPFDGAHPLPQDRLRGLAERALSVSATEADRVLEPVGARAIGVRMLSNLRDIYRDRGDHARAMLVCDRLVDLTDAPTARCDRGLHAVALGARQSALDDLEAYLEDGASGPDAALVAQILARVRASGSEPAN